MMASCKIHSFPDPTYSIDAQQRKVTPRNNEKSGIFSGVGKALNWGGGGGGGG